MKKILLVFGLIFLPIFSSAFVIENFRSELAVQENGDVFVTETIEANFTNDRKKHGIFRNIPYESQTPNGTNYTPITNFRVTDTNGKKLGLQTSKANNNHVLRIGDANKYVQENEIYVIKYTIQGVVKNFEGENFDQIYWNTTGDQWPVNIKKSSAKIILPANSKTQKSQCFTGKFGSTESKCVADTKNNSAIFATQKIITPGEGFTIVYGFDTNISTANLKFSVPKNLGNNFNSAKDSVFQSIGLDSFFTDIIAFLTALFIGLFGIISNYRKKNKLKINKPIIPKYQVPENIHPSVLGTVIDGRFDKRDFTAGIIYLATIGVLKIKKETQEIFFGNKEKISIERIFNKSHKEKFTEQDKTMLSKFFLVQNHFEFSRENGSTIYQIYNQVADTINNGNEFFVGKSVNTTTLSIPKQFGWWLLIPIAICAMINLFVTIIACIIGLIGMSIFSPKRTKEGFEMAYEIECYKEFLKTAEISQLNWASKQDIFEKNLPYAIALGLEEKWTAKFGDLIKIPNWAPVDGTTRAVGTAALMKEINQITREFESNIQAPKSSGGSGFSSGGGFSGGGSGGGGGGSW